MNVVMTVLVFTASLLTTPINAVAGEKTGEVLFNRNDKVLTWQTNNNGSFALSKDLDFRINSAFSTTLNVTAGKTVKDRWYDTINNRAELKYAISDKFDLMFSAFEDWNKDTMSRLGTSLLTTNCTGGISYNPFRGSNFSLSTANIFDRRFDNTDKGSAVQGRISYLGRPFTDDLLLNIFANLETSNLKRSTDVYRLHGGLSYYHDIADIEIAINNNRNRRGYFSDINRREIEERDRQENTINISISRGDFLNNRKATALELNVNFERSSVDDSANDNPGSSKYQNNSKARTNGFGVRIGRGISRYVTTEWEMEYSKNANGVERLNRRRAQTDIAAKGSFFIKLGSADSLEVVGRIKRTRIDTPIYVPNDRDEFKLESGVLYNRYFTDNFKTTLDFRILETHYVNIDVSQSHMNKWMKTYLLSPSLVYKPTKSLSVNHAVSIYANHSKYNFDSDFAPRSNISRRVTSESWVELRPSSKAQIEMGIMFEENDYGKLDNRWNKIPVEEGIKRFGNFSIEYIFTKWLTLNPYYIYAIRRDWSVIYDTFRPLRREVDQTFGMKCYFFRNEKGSYFILLKIIVRVTEKYPIRIRNYITVMMRYSF